MRIGWFFPAALLAALLLASSGCSSHKTYAERVAAGQELYLENGCGACHGPEGHGDGPVLKTLKITPRDFREPSSFVNGYSVEQISRTIGDGLVAETDSMPAYSHLTGDERDELAVYVMSLRDASKTNAQKESK